MENCTHRRNFLSDWLRTRNLQLPSLSDVMSTLHEYCKSACYLSLSLSNHKYPQQFLKKRKCCCVVLKVPSLSLLSLSPPSLSGLLPLQSASSCPDSTAHGVPLSSLLPACRETGAKPLLLLLEVRAFPLLQPGLTQCLQSKPVTERHRS